MQIMHHEYAGELEARENLQIQCQPGSNLCTEFVRFWEAGQWTMCGIAG